MEGFSVIKRGISIYYAYIGCLQEILTRKLGRQKVWSCWTAEENMPACQQTTKMLLTEAAKVVAGSTETKRKQKAWISGPILGRALD